MRANVHAVSSRVSLRSPLAAGMVAVLLALIVAGIWWSRERSPSSVESAMKSAVGLRITRHDSFGMPRGKPIVVRQPSRVKAIVAALGVDGQSEVACPPDYASAELGIVLSGSDVYARRDIYVWNLSGGGDAGDPGDVMPTNVLVVTSSGCHGGAPADAAALKRLIEEAETGSRDAATPTSQLR